MKSMARTWHSCSPARTAQHTLYTQPIIRKHIHTHTHRRPALPHIDVWVGAWEAIPWIMISLWSTLEISFATAEASSPFLCSSVSVLFSLLLLLLLLLFIIIFALVGEKTPPFKSAWLLDDTCYFCIFPYSALWFIPTLVQTNLFVSLLITVMDSKDFKQSHVNTVMKQTLLSYGPSLSTSRSIIDMGLVSYYCKQFICLGCAFWALCNEIFIV